MIATMYRPAEWLCPTTLGSPSCTVSSQGRKPARTPIPPQLCEKGNSAQVFRPAVCLTLGVPQAYLRLLILQAPHLETGAGGHLRELTRGWVLLLQVCSNLSIALLEALGASFRQPVEHPSSQDLPLRAPAGLRRDCPGAVTPWARVLPAASLGLALGVTPRLL